MARALVFIILISSYLHGRAQYWDDTLPSDTVIVKGARCEHCPNIIIYTRFKCGLYTGSNGDIGLRTHQAIDELNKKIVPFYMTSLRDFKWGVKRGRHQWQMRAVIDTATFRCLNEAYWADKKHVYSVMGTSDGGKVYFCRGVRPKDFKPIGESRYAIRKRNVYYLGAKMKHVDAGTFKLIDEYGNYAYDKNGVYASHGKLSTEEIKANGLEQYLPKK